MKVRFQQVEHKYLESHLFGFLQGFGGIIDGLVTVLSLGFICSNFELEIAALHMKRLLEKRKNLKE